MESQLKDEQLNDLLENALDDLLGESKPEVFEAREPNIKESLKKITEVTGATGGGKDDVSGPVGGDGAGSSSSGNSDNAGHKTEPIVDEEEMNRFFETMTAQLKAELPKIDPEEARTKLTTETVPQLFDLMQNLLSKELLYPALKDLSPKFEEWLEKNRPNLSKADKKRFRKQKDIINEIIYVFDDESLGDQERFEKNLDLMEKMQSLGSPPEELTVPEGMGKCSVM